MNTVISKLLVYMYNGYHKDVYYEIAKYILSHMNDVLDMNAGEFAQNCRTSVATVKKFCRILGYDDFNIFKQYLRSTSNIRKNQIHQRYEEFDLNKMYQHLLYISPDMIAQDVLETLCDHVVDEIYKRERIYFLASNYPLAIAFNFIEDLTIFGKNIHVQNVDIDFERSDAMDDAYCFLVSFTGRYAMLNTTHFQSFQEHELCTCVISQSQSFKERLLHVDTFIPLSLSKDSENVNMMFMIILNMIKYKYYLKYVK